MGLGRGRKVLRHPDVKLMVAAGKPDTAATSQGLGLFQFGEAEQLSIEPPRLALALNRRGNLHMIETDDLHAAHDSQEEPDPRPLPPF